MRKGMSVLLLLGLDVFSAVGASFAELRSATTPAIICNHPCSSDSQCNGECPSCEVLPGQPPNSGKCSSTFNPR